MRVAFVVPKYKNIWEPIGIGNIIEYYNNKYSNVQTSVYNYNLENLTIENLLDNDIVAFTCTTPTYPECERIATELKNRNKAIKTVIGGWHPTATPFSISEVFDYVVAGEGEVAFSKILTGDDHRYLFATPILHMVKANRELIRQDLMLDKCESICGERIASFQSRRGCANSCSFCSERLMSNNYVRIKNPAIVLDEIEYVDKEYHIDKFKFVDPTWAYPRSAVREFCNAKIKRNNTIPYEAMAHIAYLDRNILGLIKESGCAQLNFGVESGSQKILNSMHKGVTIPRIKSVFRWAKEIGIQRRAFFLLGMPDETYQTIEETRKLIYDIEPDVFGMTILCPYPGSKFWKDEFEGTDFSTMDEYSNNIWYTDNFSNQELKDIQSKFNEEFEDILVAHKR